MSKSDQYRGLRPNPHTLGVEPLEESEVSKPVRVRAKRQVHEQLKGLSAKQIGERFEDALGLELVAQKDKSELYGSDLPSTRQDGA